MNLEEIEKRTNFVVTTDADKMPERIEAAEVILREDVPALIAEVKRLRWAKWELTNNYAELQTEVKRLRKQLELEHDQGESFLTQIKELQAENERLRAKSIRNDSYMSEILNSGDGVYRP